METSLAHPQKVKHRITIRPSNSVHKYMSQRTEYRYSKQKTLPNRYIQNYSQQSDDENDPDVHEGRDYSLNT